MSWEKLRERGDSSGVGGALRLIRLLQPRNGWFDDIISVPYVSFGQ